MTFSPATDWKASEYLPSANAWLASAKLFEYPSKCVPAKTNTRMDNAITKTRITGTFGSGGVLSGSAGGFGFFSFFGFTFFSFGCFGAFSFFFFSFFFFSFPPFLSPSEEPSNSFKMSISSIGISVTAGSACISEISSSSGSSSPNSNLDSFARNPCFFGFFSSFTSSSGCTSAFALSASGISESSPVPLRILINSSSSSDTAFSFSVSESSSPKLSIPISSIARSSIPSSLASSSFFTSAVSSFCSAVFSTADAAVSAVSFAAS